LGLLRAGVAACCGAKVILCSFEAKYILSGTNITGATACDLCSLVSDVIYLVFLQKKILHYNIFIYLCTAEVSKETMLDP
jgi:hypothetical protein